MSTQRTRAAATLQNGCVVHLDLRGFYLEARTCPADDVGNWFDEHGKVRIDWNVLAVASPLAGHSTTRTDRLPGGFMRQVEVCFNPYLDDPAVRDGAWTVERVWNVNEYDRGPGGNGSYQATGAPIGRSEWMRLRQGVRVLTLCLDPGYESSLPRDRIHAVPDAKRVFVSGRAR